MSTRKSPRAKTAEEKKPAVTPKKLAMDDEKPSDENAKPAVESKGEKRPAEDELKPAEDAKKPAIEEKKAVITEKKPVVTEKKADITEKKPVVTEKKADVTEKKPVVTEKKADVTEKKPVVTEMKEEAEGEEPNKEETKPDEEKMEEDKDEDEDKKEADEDTKPEENGEASTEKDDKAPEEEDKGADDEPMEKEEEVVEKAPEGFQCFNLKPELLKGLEDLRLKNPVEVQHACIPPTLLGKDVICQTTGIGKATTFMIASLQQLVPVDFMPEVSMLIVCHKRERAHSIAEDVRKMGRHMSTLRVAAYSGGRDLSRDEEYLKKSCPHIMVCTPGRLLSLLRTKIVNLSHLKHVVIDRIDRMVHYDDLFEHLKESFEYLPEKKQVTIFCSSLTMETLPDFKQFVHDPIEVFLDGKPKSQLRGVQQHFITITEDKAKVKKLLEILKALSSTRVIVFANTTKACMTVSKQLTDRGFPAVAVHRDEGDVHDSDSHVGLEGHWISCYLPPPNLDDDGGHRGDRSRRRPIMVATDLPYCNIDSMNIVINYDTPQEWLTYSLRVTAAYPTSRDPTGNIAITFVSDDDDKETLLTAEKELGVEITEVPVDSDIFRKAL